MKIENLPEAPSDTVDIIIKILPGHRAQVHFHLEASDGFGYLENVGDPELGVIHTAPHRVDEMLAWLKALSEEDGLEIEVLEVKPSPSPYA